MDIPRRAYLVSLCLTVYASYKLAKVWLKLVKHSEEETDTLWDRVNARNAKRIYGGIVFLQGLWIKVGQYVSTRTDVLPETMTRELKSLQDSVPAKPLSQTLETVKRAIADFDSTFAAFGEDPLATASIAQVHRATIKADGSPVVVKVQHQRISSQVLRDLSDFRSLVATIAYFEPDYDFSFVVNEWVAEVPHELDFVHEAENTREVSDAVEVHNLALAAEGRGLDDPLYLDCGFATPMSYLTTKEVFVMSFIDGVKITDAEALRERGVDVKSVVTSIIKSYAFQIFYLGFWNGDPHPGNFLIAKSTDGSRDIPYLLDFGLTKRATSKEAMALSRLILSAFHKDLTGLQSALVDLGVKGMTENVDTDKSMEIIQFIFRDTTTRANAQTQLEARRKKREKEREEAKAKKKLDPPEAKKPRTQRSVSDAFPGILVFFLRVLDLLRGLSTSLDVELDFLGIMAPFATHYLEGQTRERRFGALGGEERDGLSEMQRRVEALLRSKIDSGDVVGAQVVAFEKVKVIVDVAAGVMGVFDPRPVLPDSLFPVFSVTKAIAAVALNKLVAQGRLQYDDPVSKYWPDFLTNMPASATPQQRTWKASITARHLLDHQSGLEAAGKDEAAADLFAMVDFDAMVLAMESAVPVRAPGVETRYQIMSFGWLVGGLAEKVAGEKFGDQLKQVLEGVGAGDWAYVGIPKGVETRLATLFWDSKEAEQVQKALETMQGVGADGQRLSAMVGNPTLFNDLRVRRSVIPAASGNMSARGMALVLDRVVSCRSGSEDPLLASAALVDPHHPAHPSAFRYGFAQYLGSTVGGGHEPREKRLFGHSGLGGSTVVADPERGITLAVALNKLTLFRQDVTQELVQIVMGVDLTRMEDVSMNPINAQT
ncbi:beta-lactamase/transpeptidase-like protein [Chytriomyces sp. MP71]|nr:beta-lactamase/transpeptidase-like protein [Chytriomyces sp. MP71]